MRVESHGGRWHTSNVPTKPRRRIRLQPLARKIFWWKSPAEALRDPVRFAAQVMTYGNWEETRLARRALGDAVFRAALDRPPAGVFDERSWAYWHVVFGKQKIPPMPLRKLS